MKKIELQWIGRTKVTSKSLSNSAKGKLCYFLKELTSNPYKTDWLLIYKWEKLEHETYKELPIYSLRLNKKDRFCYAIDESTNELIIIAIINTNGHYSHMSNKRTLGELKSACITKEQKIAFNNLLDSLKFKAE